MNQNQRHIEERFRDFFTEQRLSLEKTYLVAVSGGLDSVVLCDLFYRSGIPFQIAHCNFKLRGAESDRDELFTRALAEKYQVPFWLQQFDTDHYAEKNKLSIQEAARKLRYDWFYQVLAENNLSGIATAHHADDNLETLLMHFFRGTGLQGLTGIPAKNDSLIRPMLQIRRKELLEYAEANELKWVEDSSNVSIKYTRNYFRNELIPALTRIYPEAEKNLLQNIDRFKKIHAFYKTAIEQARKQLVESNNGVFRIPVHKLKKMDYEILLYEITRDFGFGEKQLPDLIRLMDAGSGKFIASEDYQVIKHGSWLIIAPRSYESPVVAIGKDDELVEFVGGRISVKNMEAGDFKRQRSETLAQLDAKHIEYPLLLRKWKQGDYFYPLGMPKKKKVARFLIDARVPKHEKENIWVIESNQKIIWVVGHRIDHRFRVTENTRSILLLTYQHQLL